MAFAWLAASGSQLDIMQAFAWSGMFVKHSQTLPLQVAIAETFNPEKPCALCLAVQKARTGGEEDKLPTIEKVERKIILWVVVNPAGLFSMSVREPVSTAFEHGVTYSRLKPPAPPPRVA